MSYILDALRRADAERERGAVPSLHTQQYGALPGDEGEAPRRARLPTIVAALLAVALLAVLGWHDLGGDAPPRAAVQVAAAPPATVAVAAAPVDAGAASGSAAVVAGTASGTGAVNESRTGTDTGRAATTPAPSPTATVRRGQRRDLATTTPTTTSATNVATPVSPAASGSDRVYAMADLPDDVRRDLPKLAFGGASYSSDPSSRMVILNGQVFHEGDGITRGVVLQRVNRKSAILVVRGYRFELAF